MRVSRIPDLSHPSTCLTGFVSFLDAEGYQAQVIRRRSAGRLFGSRELPGGDCENPPESVHCRLSEILDAIDGV